MSETFYFPTKASPSVSPVVVDGLENFPTSRILQSNQSLDENIEGDIQSYNLSPRVRLIEINYENLKFADKENLINFIKDIVDFTALSFEYEDSEGNLYTNCKFWFDDFDETQTSFEFFAGIILIRQELASTATPPADFDTGLAMQTGGPFRVVIQIDRINGAGTLFLSDQEITISAQVYEPRIMEVSKLLNQLSVGDDRIKVSSINITLENSSSKIHDKIEQNAVVRVYYYFEGLAVGELRQIYTGVITEDINYDLYTISFGTKDASTQFDNFVGRVITESEFPDSLEAHRGKQAPILIGKNRMWSRSVIIDKGAISRIISIGGGVIVLEDASKFPSGSNPLTLRRSGEFFILPRGSYTGKSGNTLTGVTGAAYSIGDVIFHAGVNVVYMLADHETKTGLVDPDDLLFQKPGNDQVMNWHSAVTRASAIINHANTSFTGGTITTIEVDPFIFLVDSQGYTFTGGIVSGWHASQLDLMALNMLGAKDDGSGTFTGVADALIEHPADVIHWLLINYGNNISASDIDLTGSFTDLKTDSNTSSFEWAFVVDRVIKLMELITLLAPQTAARFFYDVNIFVLSRLKNGTDPRATVTDSDIPISSDKRFPVEVFPGNLSEIANHIFILSQLDYSLGTWVADPGAGTNKPNDSDNIYSSSIETINTGSITSYGLRKKYIRLWAVYDTSMAALLRTTYRSLLNNPRDTVTFPVFMSELNNLVRGDVVSYSNSDLDLSGLYEALEINMRHPKALNNQAPMLDLVLRDLRL